MHELGVVIKVVNTVESFAKSNGITNIDTLIIQIGEISSMIPRYIKACYPAAVDGTMLENTKLEIEVLPANGMCKNCHKVFNVVENKFTCPHCNENDIELLSGKEFMIKEIIAS